MKNQVFISTKRSSKRIAKAPSLKFEHNPTAEWQALNIYPELKYQEVIGFGSALTDSAATCYGKMKDETKKAFVEACFDKEKGIGLNYCRAHINSCDFSAQEYTYTKENDTKLETFSVDHDKVNVIPMIKAALAQNEDLKIYSSPWSPPAWMKTNGKMEEGGKLKEEHFGTWANYFVKYIEEYKKNGIEIGAVTVQNESMAPQTWESCIYTAEEQILFVRDYLYPAFKKANLDVKIMIWDHNKERAYEWAKAVTEIEGASDCIWALAFHWYSGDHFDNLKFAHEVAPKLKLIESEYCFGGSKPVEGQPSKYRYMASFDEAMKYAYDITENFNSFMNATTDWNLMLDENGGPYQKRYSGCKAPVIYDSTEDTFTLCDTYYAFGHFSKFIERGAVRLGTSKWNEKISICAFENPNGDIVAVITNRNNKPSKNFLRIHEQAATFILKPNSITTVVIKK